MKEHTYVTTLCKTYIWKVPTLGLHNTSHESFRKYCHKIYAKLIYIWASKREQRRTYNYHRVVTVWDCLLCIFILILQAIILFLLTALYTLLWSISLICMYLADVNKWSSRRYAVLHNSVINAKLMTTLVWVYLAKTWVCTGP